MTEAPESGGGSNRPPRTSSRSEAESLARARVDGARRAAGELLAPLAHDLRSGLTGILGWAQVLERVTDDATRSRAIDGIRRAVAHQTRLAEDVADAGRALLAARENPEAPEDVNVAATLRAAAAELAEAARARNIEFRFALPAGVPTVRCDADVIRRLAHLLLGDALLQTPTGGTITVTVSEREDSVIVEFGDAGALVTESTVAVDPNRSEPRQITGNVRRVIATLLARVLGGQVTNGRAGLMQATLPRRFAG